MDEEIDVSRSFAKRRHRPSHAKVRSTTHLRGMTSNPMGGIGSLDDFNSPVTNFSQIAARLIARLAPIGKDMTQPRIGIADGFQYINSPVAVPNISAVNNDTHHIAGCVGDDMTFASFDLFARVIAPNAAAFGKWSARKYMSMIPLYQGQNQTQGAVA